MTKSFIFDVDGTLTPSRGRIDEDFRLWFAQFCWDNDVYMVTGSDKAKTVEQVGEYIYNLCKRVYQCAGNDIWEQDNNIKKPAFMTLPDIAEEYLDRQLNYTDWVPLTGAHFDYRPGLINFSILGRNATVEQRKMYCNYDKQVGERYRIAQGFNERFPQYQASVAGEIGIDITVKGCNKSQILKDFDAAGLYFENITFFGDKCEYDGNDYEISRAVAFGGGTIYQVKDWKDTWVKLKGII
jgi:phosphomannomutase